MYTRKPKLALALLLFFVFVDVAIPGKVYTDYDPSVNFSQYRTFIWIKPPHMRDPLMNDRIVNAINAALTAKGWRLVDEGADVGVAAHVATREQHTLETFYSGFGGGWFWHRWGIGTGMATTTEETYTVGTLVVDLFDSRTRKLIWRGKATDILPEDPKKTAKKLNKDIEKLFKKFPPK
jgi:hypothetical protein